MKKINLLVVLLLASCGRTPICNVSWSCGNASCARSEGAWTGSGSFTGNNDESDCLVWSTAFLNSQGYPYNTVSACSCN